VTCPLSNTAEDGSIATLKRRTCDFADQQMSHDDERISYLEIAEEHDYCYGWSAIVCDVHVMG
jgi:hypothetical protein